MINPFKNEEKKPISFASVEMQKAPRNYVKWALIVVLGIGALIAIFFWER